MKSVVAAIAAVLVLALTGYAFRRAAVIEDGLATAHAQLLTTTRIDPAVDGQLDDSVNLVGRVPVIGPRIAREVRHQRADAAYWQGNYGALLPGASSPLAPTGNDDPALLLLSADATFRNAVRANRTPQTLVRSLDEVLKAYGEALKADPASRDAAYNYEYVTRLRAALAGGRGATVPTPRENSMQGEEGEPPKGSNKSDFNVIVPLRPEERQEQMDPGAGAEFKRQG